MQADCIICNIISASQNAHIVYEDDYFIAFLDHHPLFIGHTLLAPKSHATTLYDLPFAQGSLLLSALQKVGRAVTLAMQAEGTFIAANNHVSQSIPHMHIHIVPRTKRDGLKGFFWPRTRYASEAEMRETQQAIIHALSNST